MSVKTNAQTISFCTGFYMEPRRASIGSVRTDPSSNETRPGGGTSLDEVNSPAQLVFTFGRRSLIVVFVKFLQLHIKNFQCYLRT